MSLDLPRLMTLSGGSLAEWREALPAAIADRMQTPHGDLADWQAVLESARPLTATPRCVHISGNCCFGCVHGVRVHSRCSGR